MNNHQRAHTHTHNFSTLQQVRRPGNCPCASVREERNVGSIFSPRRTRVRAYATRLPDRSWRGVRDSGCDSLLFVAVLDDICTLISRTQRDRLRRASAKPVQTPPKSNGVPLILYMGAFFLLLCTVVAEQNFPRAFPRLLERGKSGADCPTRYFFRKGNTFYHITQLHAPHSHTNTYAQFPERMTIEFLT